jgi:acyl-CoA reductase-like NAD-dependent aldehyde dehydrogenase
MGQPITLAKRMILGPAATWKYYAGYAGKVAGESYPPDEDGTYKIVQYEPLGEWIFFPNLAFEESSFENLHSFLV